MENNGSIFLLFVFLIPLSELVPEVLTWPGESEAQGKKGGAVYCSFKILAEA